jgi:integrase
MRDMGPPVDVRHRPRSAPWDRASPWDGIRPFLDEPLPRLHDLRHTCVTLLTEGTAPHVVQQIVGHSGIDVTMTIYAHTSLEEKRKALRLLGERLA